VLRRGDLELDPGRLDAARGGRPLRLTPREFAVLELLVRAEGRLVSAEELLERAWDENADRFTSVVRVVVSRLRGKLGEPDAITTIPGTGYRIP
ncbi:MAG: winged helix-turn-helix domain-containing protein, partial [Gaiellaceae bacterium]